MGVVPAIGVSRLPVAASAAASVIETVSERFIVPPGIELFTFTANTTEPVSPAARLPTLNVYVDPAPPLPEVLTHPVVLLAELNEVLAGTVSVRTTPEALTPVPPTMLPALW